MKRSERHALWTTVLVPVIGFTVACDAPLWCGLVLLFIAPVAVLWLVWTVLHDTTDPSGELPPGHEWDYRDRPDLAKR